MLAKFKKAACTFRNGDSNNCLGQLTKVSPLGDISEPVKVDIGARYYRDDSVIFEVVVIDVIFSLPQLPMHLQAPPPSGHLHKYL